jgi:hypothetical protein
LCNGPAQVLDVSARHEAAEPHRTLRDLLPIAITEVARVRVRAAGDRRG